MLSAQIKSPSSPNYSASSWPISLLLGCDDGFKSPCRRILLERLWVWISVKLPTVVTEVLLGVIWSAEKYVGCQPSNLIYIRCTAFCSILHLNLMWHKGEKNAFCARYEGIRESGRTVPHTFLTLWLVSGQLDAPASLPWGKLPLYECNGGLCRP